MDVKGRKFPYNGTGGKRYWENWVTRDDLDGLTEWQRVFGQGFCAMLIFVYWLIGTSERLPTSYVHTFRDEPYSFLCIPLDDYQTHCRPRSPKWGTVTVPAATFRKLATPIHLL